MSISTDSPDHGELHQGWSQQESASPHIVGDTAGGTRQTGFSAIAGAKSDMLIGTDLDVDGPFDSVGNVLDVTLTGDVVATSSYDIDSKFLPAREFPAVASGYPEAALDLTQRLYGEGVVDVPWPVAPAVHAYYPLRGYNQGFALGSGVPYYQGTWGRAIVTDGNPDSSWYTGVHAAPAWDWVRFAEGVFCKSARILVNPTINGTNVNYVAFRARLNASTNLRTFINMAWGGFNTDISVRVARAAGTLGTIDTFGAYRQHGAGSLTNIPQTSITATGLDMSKEFAVVVQWGYLTNDPGATLRVKCYVYDPANPPVGAPPLVHQIDLTNAMRSELVANNTLIEQRVGVCGFRDLILSQHTGWAHHYPVIPEPALISHSFAKTNLAVLPVNNAASYRPPTPAWEGSGWEYLKHLAAAEELQMRVTAGKLHFEALSTAAPIPVRDTIAPPQLSIRGSGRARTVDVVAHKSDVWRTFGTTNHWADVSITVRVDEESRHSIPLPAGEHLIGRVTLILTDNSGVPVTPGDMWRRGARFTPISAGDGVLMLNVRGPKDSVGLGVGPWRITQVQIANQGFFETPETIELHTGAAEAMITREKGATVDNPFLTSVGRAIERGSWAAQAYGLPEMPLSFAVPASRRLDYLPGTLVSYGHAVYRVTSVKHSKARTTVEASRYVTVAMRDAAWAGYTIAQHDAYTAGKRILDAHLRPLDTPAPRAPFVRAYPSESRY